MDGNAGATWRIVPTWTFGAVFSAIAALALLLVTAACDGSGNALVSYTWKPMSQPIGFRTADDLGHKGGFAGFAQAMQAASHLWQHQAAWTGQEMFVWGEGGSGLYNPKTDTWRKVSLQGAPTERRYSLLVWTGQEVIVCYEGPGERPAGARYNPATDSWKSIATADVPMSAINATAVWTGKEMIVFWQGGYGAAYNPTTDSWRSLSRQGAPPMGQDGFSAVWTGKEVLVWGGSLWVNPTRVLNEGARYDPDTDTWSPISSAGAPTPRIGPMVVWTGHEMLVVGGLLQPVPNPLNHTGDPLMTEANYANDGARYDPSTDTWSPSRPPPCCQPLAISSRIA